MVIPYKIDTGSDGNIMPWYIFKKLFPRVTVSQFTRTIKNHIKLKMCNKTHNPARNICSNYILQNNRRKCEFFVVLGNGQALFHIPDTAVLNIINVNIDSIEAEDTQRENCNTNISDAKTSNAKQETDGAKECSTNTDDSLKNTNNDNRSAGNTNTNTLRNYFLSSPNIEIDKRSAKLTQKIYNGFDNVLMVLGALKAHFHYSSNMIASPIKCHQDV